MVPASTGSRAIADAVADELRSFFASRRALVDSVGPDFARAAADLESFVMRGGKRVRPAFAWLGWLGADGSADDQRVFRICAALELIQACALIHDDIIDSSRTRRGFPTVHVAYAARHREQHWLGAADHFGSSVAIIVGDLALAWADDMVREGGLTGPAGDVWTAMRTEVLGGQLLDIVGEADGNETVDSALRINRFKTAAYTIERPLHLGAALAGADAALIDAYRTFGTDVGIAFQLRDDLLGVFGDPEVTGKPSGDDLREGKRTALLAIALERADAATADLLRSKIGTELTDDEVETLRAALAATGAVDDVEQRITDLTHKGLEALHASSTRDDIKQRLHELAEAATRRTF